MKKIILKILLVFFILLFIYSLVNIIIWVIDTGKTDEQIKNIQEIANVIDTQSTENKNELKINFSELENINPDVVGWIKVNGTNINYPFVQAENNDFYLDHSFDKSYNKAGWVFLDYRNNEEKLDKNMILYAHNRQDGTMFETLKNAIDEKWQSEEENLEIQMYLKDKILKYRVFSVYIIPNTDDYLAVNFNTDNDFQAFINKIKSRSIKDFEINVDTNDNILTLSSCYINSQRRIVVHAKLIK